MLWNNHTRDIPKGSHAFLSPSAHSWCNYNDEKLVQTYVSKLAASRGTALHELAQDLIQLKVKLPDIRQTLPMYVNDAIDLALEPEVSLFYSRFCYGTADAIGLKDDELIIHDLKTGLTKVSFLQLEIYAALFFLEYEHYKPSEMKVSLRIYQNDEVMEETPSSEIIVPIMDRIIRFSRVLESLEANYGDGIG